MRRPEDPRGRCGDSHPPTFHDNFRRLAACRFRCVEADQPGRQLGRSSPGLTALYDAVDARSSGRRVLAGAIVVVDEDNAQTLDAVVEHASGRGLPGGRRRCRRQTVAENPPANCPTSRRSPADDRPFARAIEPRTRLPFCPHHARRLRPIPPSLRVTVANCRPYRRAMRDIQQTPQPRFLAMGGPVRDHGAVLLAGALMRGRCLSGLPPIAGAASPTSPHQECGEIFRPVASTVVVRGQRRDLSLAFIVGGRCGLDISRASGPASAACSRNADRGGTAICSSRRRGMSAGIRVR
jgi:hypothetical protein